MNRPERTTLDDPTAERTADPVGGPRPVEDVEVVRRRPEERDSTPRRYEQPVDDDPVMPSDDSSVTTKI